MARNKTVVLEDLTGQKFDRLLVIRWWGKNKFRMNKWLCRCKCGKQSICLGQQLKNKRVQSCGCKARERYRDMLEDLTGKRFGSLTVLHRIKTNFSHPIWKCVCDCGEETNVAASNLRSHSIKSCGCYRKKRMSTIASKYHGASHPQYNSNITNEERKIKRNVPENRLWKKGVLERGKYTCSVCGKTGGSLIAHHLNSYHWCKEERFEVVNGVTLCESCYHKFHRKFGIKNNTVIQFNQFKKAQ